MDIFLQFAPIMHQIICDTAGTAIVYSPRASESVALIAAVERGAEFEAAHEGLWCSVTMRLSDLAASPSAGDEITIDGHVCQVVKGAAKDAYGGVTVFARFVRMAE
jgi:hypothetical protein